MDSSTDRVHSNRRCFCPELDARVRKWTRTRPPTYSVQQMSQRSRPSASERVSEIIGHPSKPQLGVFLVWSLSVKVCPGVSGIGTENFDSLVVDRLKFLGVTGSGDSWKDLLTACQRPNKRQ